MDPNRQIRAFLGAVRRRLRRHDAAKAGLYVLAVAGLAALLTPLLALVTGLGAANIIGSAAIGLGASLVVSGTYVGIIYPRLRWRNDEQVARYVGTEVEPVASDLLSAVELGTTEIDDTRLSTELVDALVQQTASEVDDLEPRELVPRDRLRRPAVVLLGVAAAYALVFMAKPNAFANGWKRVFAAPTPSPFGGAKLSKQPLVGDIEITLDYPLYTKRPQVKLPSSSGDFLAMAGTRVSIRTTALTSATKAKILFGVGDDTEREPIDMKVDARGPGGEGAILTAEFNVTKPLKYRFLVEDAKGKRKVEADPHNIEIEADNPPKVELYAPANELDVTSLKRIELAYIIEDDHGIAKIDLVWKDRGKAQKKTLPTQFGKRRAQRKFLWDLAELSLRPGAKVAYHLEVTDNDDVLGPNIAKSRTFYLRVFSQRERHERIVDRQEVTFEKMVKLLGARLTVDPEDLRAHHFMQRTTAAVVVELGGIVASLKEDKMASKKLIKQLGDMRSRLDALGKREQKLLARLDKLRNPKVIGAQLKVANKPHVVELENDVLMLANWIDRQRMEVLLAISDEIKKHQARLKALMDEYKRTKDPKLKDEIDREMRALQQKLAELRTKRRKLTSDVLDRFVNTDALKANKAKECMDEVRALFKAGKVAAAQKKLKECNRTIDKSANAMENALRALRGDKFSAGERKLNQLMNDLADLAKDQKDIADAADKIWRRYAKKAAKMMRKKAKKMRKKVGKTIDKLRKRLDKIPEDGLTTFSKEELDIVKNRLKSVKNMLKDGDIAEALAMAKQAKQSLDAVEAELDAAIRDAKQWGGQTKKARKATRKAMPLARKIVKDLEAATPSPKDIMSKKDRARLDRLRRRQQAAQGRAQRLAQRAKGMSKDLPGRSGKQISQGVNGAAEQMGRAKQRMRAKDPSGSRLEARGAAEKLDRARKDAQGAARMRQRSGRARLRDEPVRIPGANEYKAPEKFREDILEAMKKEKAPQGFGDMVKRYYEELIR